MTIEQLVEKQRAAQAAVDAALAEGVDTTKPRKALEVATRAVEDARAAQVAEQRTAQEVEDTRITALATAMVAEITEPMRASLTEVLSGVEHPDFPDEATTRAAAAALIRARERLDSTREALVEAEQRQTQLRERIEGLVAERQAIIERRIRGEQRPDDAAQVTLLEADREGLERLEKQVDASVTKVQNALKEAETEVSNKEWQLSLAVYRLQKDALRPAVEIAESKLVAAIEAMTKDAPNWNIRHIWKPGSHELRLRISGAGYSS